MKKRPGMAHSFKKLETSHTGILSPIVSVLSLFLISIFHLSLSHSRTRGYYWSESNTMGRCQKRNFGWDQLSKFLLNEKMRTKTFFSTSSCDVIGSNKRPSGDIVGPDNCSHFWTAPKKFNVKKNKHLGSDCGSVGRAVTSDCRGLRFESSHQQILNEPLLSTLLKRHK